MPQPPKDLLDYLLQKWEEQDREDSQEITEHRRLFVEFGRQVLKENRPVSVEYTGDVLALRLQDLTTLPIVHLADDEVQQMGNPGPSYGITKTRTTQSGIAPGRAWGVTGQKSSKD